MKPLSHLTVVDMTVNLPGPFCSEILADLGARVIKVEPPGGDPLRHSPHMWASLNRGKESITLNLKSTTGRQILQDLIAKADIFLEGSRPGVAKRLGADYTTLATINPDLVYCSISGFGQDGPWTNRPAHDINYLALSGYLSTQSTIEGNPAPPPILISDLASGLYSTIAILAAITSRQANGKGTFIDLSMTDSALSLLGLEIAKSSDHSISDQKPNVSYIPHYGVFPCSDGKWMTLGIVHEDHFWDRLCNITEINDLSGLDFDQRLDRADEIKERLHKLFITKTSEEWEQLLYNADIPAAAVLDIWEVLKSDHFKHRGSFVNIDLYRHVILPFNFSNASVSPEPKISTTGENTKTIITNLGYTSEEFELFTQADAFGSLDKGD